MTKINMAPLSVNKAYSGRHFPTRELKEFKNSFPFLLPKHIKIPEDKIQIKLLFGVSNKGSDVDNLCKCVIDGLSSSYEFNDNRVYKVIAEKSIVEKGNEFIEFEITEYKQ